jgi:formyltetrahydrofolate hydrolase
VYGADRPGIVHRVTSQLAKTKVNLSDLSTHRTEAEGKTVGLHLVSGGGNPGRGDARRFEKISATNSGGDGRHRFRQTASSQTL